jgi:salicylate hydroxylase
MAAEPAPIRLAVVGGGIAGLGLAIGLLHHPAGPNPRLKVTIYESSPALSEVGAGIAMGPNSLGAIELLSSELRRRLEERGMRVAGRDAHSYACFRYGGAGEHEDALVADVSGEGQSTLHRRHLVEELANMLPRGIVQYGKKAVRVRNNTNDVSIEFDDGTTDTADFVVGADGIHGCTRRTVLGEDSPQVDPLFSGIYTYRNLVPMDDIEPVLGKDVARAANVFVGPSAYLVTFPVDNGRSVNLAGVTVTDKPWTHPSWTVPVPEGSAESDYPADKWSRTTQGLLPVSGNLALPS